MIFAFTSALFAGSVLYLAGVLYVITGIRGKKPIDCRNTPPVSVVIAARNERQNMQTCIASLLRQDYPPELLHIVIADDRSTDGTGDIARSFQQPSPIITVVRIEDCPVGVSPKKHALSKALDQVGTDIVLQTDADCVMSPGWIRSMTAHFSDDTGMVVGVAPYSQGDGWLNSFVRHEYLWNSALAHGSIGRNRGTHASGRNMAFRMSAFKEAGGYGDGLAVMSGDDTLLLHGIQRKTSYRIISAVSKESHVFTGSPKTVKALLRQRLRHMSTGKYFEPSHILLAAGIYGFHLIFLISLSISIAHTPLILPILLSLLVKISADIFACNQVRNKIGLEVEWMRFPQNEILLILYMTLIPLLGSVISVTWKENY